MNELLLEAFVILVLLLVNGVFSMSELAVMTARRSRLEHRVEENDDAGARAALELAAHPTAFLSTVQIGITLVGVLAGAFGGAGIAEVVAAQFASVSWLARWADAAAFALVVAIITYLSLIFGELVPKRIALGNPERVAAWIARPMRLIARVGGPVVGFLTGSTNFILRLLGLGAAAAPGVTEHDIRALVEQGAESGAVLGTEHQVVENAFRLGDRPVRAVMTPRQELPWVDLESAEVTELAALGASPVLACEGGLERVVGVLEAPRLLVHCLTAATPLDSATLRAMAQPPLFVPAMMPAIRLVDAFRRSGATAVIALDEYGAVDGMVTRDDLVASLLQALPATTDPTTSGDALVRQEDGSWLVDGTTPLVDVEHRLDLDATEEERRAVVTVAGLVMARLGHVPRVGDVITWEGRPVEVVRMEGRRVDLLRIGGARDDDVQSRSVSS